MSPTRPHSALPDVLHCMCGGALEMDPGSSALRCGTCGQEYPVDDGIACFTSATASAGCAEVGLPAESHDIDEHAALRLDATASMAFARGFLDRIGEWLMSPVDTYLEIGAATGQFTLGFIHLMNPRISVVTDPATQLLRTCRRRLLAHGIASDRVGFAAWDGADCLKPGAVDFVACLTHPQPGSGLQSLLPTIHAALRPGGVAMLHQPNGRFWTAVVTVLCDIWLATRTSTEWTAADREALAGWLRCQGAAAPTGNWTGWKPGEACHPPPQDGDGLRQLGRQAGFSDTELIGVDDDRFSVIEGLATQWALADRARGDLLSRYARLMQAPFASMAREDFSACSLVLLRKATAAEPPRPGRPPPLCDDAARQRWTRPTRCDLAFSWDADRQTSGAGATGEPVLRCQGWILGDDDLRAVALRQAGREWLFPVGAWRPDVHDHLNAGDDYPVVRALYSGIDHVVRDAPPPATGRLSAYAIDCQGRTTYLGPVTIEGDATRASLLL